MTTSTTPAPAAALESDRGTAMTHARIAYRRFADVAGQIGPTDWARATDCEGWTVRDLVGHVVGAMRSAASVREFASQQREIRSRVRSGGGSEVDVMTQVQIDRTSNLSTAALTAECTRLVEPATRGRRRTPAPLRRFVRFRVVMGSIDETWNLGYLVDVILTRDAWLHRIDLCGALGQTPELTDSHDGFLVRQVATEWARRHGRPVQLVLTGPAGCTLEFGHGGERLELDAVEFCRTVSGRTAGSGLLATEVPF